MSVPGYARRDVPVELTERAIREVLAVLEEWDADSARDAESALAWMGWDGEGSLFLRRYDVQLFVWYQLEPEKSFGQAGLELAGRLFGLG